MASTKYAPPEPVAEDRELLESLHAYETCLAEADAAYKAGDMDEHADRHVCLATLTRRAARLLRRRGVGIVHGGYHYRHCGGGFERIRMDVVPPGSPGLRPAGS
jgi:hypothetical protein